MDKLAAQLRAMGVSDAAIATARVSGRLPWEADIPWSQRDRMTVHANGGLEFAIFGKPVAKPRMTRRDKWDKRKCVVQYRQWCDRVRRLVGRYIPPAETVLELNWTAYFEPPKSWNKMRRVDAMGTLHRQTPDRDNIDKAVLDCLYKRDEAIADGTIRKRWDWRARLEVEIITKEEPNE